MTRPFSNYDKSISDYDETISDYDQLMEFDCDKSTYNYDKSISRYDKSISNYGKSISNYDVAEHTDHHEFFFEVILLENFRGDADNLALDLLCGKNEGLFLRHVAKMVDFQIENTG